MAGSLNRWLIITLASLFNLSFEYAFRGYQQFIDRPLLALFLFFSYVAIFAILEDLIVRFRLSNGQLVLAVWPLGLIPMGLGTGVIFYNPQALGINWASTVFILLLWWGILQSILAFYLANRLVNRDWEHPRMGRLGWGISLGFLVVAYGLVRVLMPPAAQGSGIGIIVFFALIAFPVILLRRTLAYTSRSPWAFRQSVVLDMIAFGSLVLFLLLGTLYGGEQSFDTQSSSHINLEAKKVLVIWTFVYTAVFVGYRIISGREVTV